MAQDNLYTELVSLVYTNLELDCPVLSGNMRNNITHEEIGQNYTKLSVAGPSYDTNLWRKKGVVVHTYEYDYAVSVNNVGAFNGRSTKSKHWANKSIAKACRAIAQKYNAEVVVNVEL